MSIGPHKIAYEVIQGWERLPEGWSFVEVAGVAVDSQDRVFVFNRGEHPIIVFDKEGKFLDAWGEGMFADAHGIFIDKHDRLYLADHEDHTVKVCDTNGKQLFKLGESGKPSHTGYKRHESPVLFGGGPFNKVTNVAIGENGEMYIADGYGNARVHRFAADGTLISSWGQPGSGPGEFNLPHAIAVDSGNRVYVADRENSRVQIFSKDGVFIKAWDWLNRPSDIFIDDQDNIYIAELGWMMPSKGIMLHNNYKGPPVGHDPIARVTICDPDGMVIGRFGGPDPMLPGNFIAPHGIWVDSLGDLYCGEVVKTSGAVEHLAPIEVRSFQKFKRAGGPRR
jgi:hypothetical protein